jgi:light-regulated signal transduction histidine kinase (bacteriophytochrome)
MTELEKELKNINQRINKLRKRIKHDLQEIVSLVREGNLLLSTYKSQSKSYFSRNLARLFKCKEGTANQFVRSIKVMEKREKTDRIFLEELNIIEKPNRKNLNRSKASKPPILVLGELVGKIRHLNEQGLSDTNRAIAANMLTQLQGELKD